MGIRITRSLRALMRREVARGVTEMTSPFAALLACTRLEWQCKHGEGKKR
jgi:hypothetical protein